jgi:hypothetical protein
LTSLLKREGHQVVVAVDEAERREGGGGPKLRKRLGLPGVEALEYEPFSDPARGHALGALRLARSYLWFFDPPQSASAHNREKMGRRLARYLGVPEWPDPPGGSDAPRKLATGLAAVEAALPPDEGIVRLIRDVRPDVVLVTPLLLHESPQTEVVKAASRAGIPTGLVLYSWDNLSNKGAFHALPDRIFVWNERQRREAVELHGIESERVVVTGAPRLDAFFAMEPSTDRSELCRRHGFDPAQPIVLYVASSDTVCRNEPAVVDGWLEALRHAEDQALRRANVLIRQYPRNAPSAWDAWEPPDPHVSTNRSPEKGGQELYDELHHAAAVVGLNTTAQIEAAVVGRPVYTFAAGDLAPGQAGSLHFRYLLRDDGGSVEYAETLGEHVRQLARGVSGDFDREAIRRFAETFLRPHGIAQPATPILAKEILALGRSRVRRRHLRPRIPLALRPAGSAGRGR